MALDMAWRFRLAESSTSVRRLTATRLDAFSLTEVGRKAVTITRAGTFYDPRYGEFEISTALLAEMVRNFDARAYGQDIFIDVAHRPEDGSAGRITRLWVDGDRLLADVEWTPYGREAIATRGYQYLSAEFDENFVDNETRQPRGAVLLGAGLTIRPVIKRLDPIQLSEPTHRALAAQLIAEATSQVNKHLQALLKRLAELKLAQPVIDQLSKTFSETAKTLGEDDKALGDLADRLADAGKLLAEQIGEKPAVIQLTLPPPAAPKPETPKPDAPKTLTEDDVRKLLAAERQREAEEAAATAKTLTERKAQFVALTEKAESLKGLPEATRAKLLAMETLITATTTPAQVETMAAQVIALADQMAVSTQLASLGWPMQGSARITTGEDTSPVKLQAAINDKLALSGRKLKLTAEKDLKPSVRKVLAEFDHLHGAELAAEAKRLADGGATTVSNMNVPVGFQRTVIREALSDLAILDLVQVSTDPVAQVVTTIPYELRKPGVVVNDGIVYEGREIPRASIVQKMDSAYVNKMALSLLISNESAFFSRSSLIDWDAYARNVESNARLMRELVARRVANELQRSADAYSPTTRTAENIASQLAGSASLVKTTYWPIVRPQQVRDLQGNAVGSAVNPIILILNGATLAEFDGSGEQTAGTYWKVESYNLGLIRLVDQTGAAVTPTASTTTTLTYASANNVSKFDLKLPTGVELEDHLNGALRAVGARKAIMSADRYVTPDMLLMSPVLNETLTNARQFAAEMMRAGSSLDSGGNLATIKAIPTYGTNAPGLDLADDRIILGASGILSYVIVKPFAIGAPFEAVGPNGKPTGERMAYGEEYNAMHVPLPLQNRLTSIIVYDSDARTAAA